MKQLLLPFVALVMVLATQETAPAQLPYVRPGTSPFMQPAVSPYINLLRPGINPAVSYYGTIQPQMQLYSAGNYFQQQIASNQVGIAGLQQAATSSLVTGHGVAFLNTGGYFMNLSPQGQGGFLRGSSGGGGFAGQSVSTAFNRTSSTGAGTAPTPGGATSGASTGTIRH
jgi:hypothetical protein